jgi:CheY-like chemotaxis protein
VVDDEHDLRLMTRLMLERAGFEVVDTGSGAGALELLAADSFDVVVLDLRMPQPDGWAVLERAHEQGLFGDAAVIVVSAHIDPAMADRARALGCRGYLPKPFTMEALTAAVSDAVADAVTAAVTGQRVVPVSGDNR